MHEGFERWLCCIGTPFADCSRCYAELLGQPFVGLALVNQYNFNAINVMFHFGYFISITAQI